MFLVSLIVCVGEERPLKQLSPRLIEDDEFVAKMDLMDGLPLTKPWVNVECGFWDSQVLDDKYTTPYIGNFKEVEMRLFLVSEGIAFKGIMREIDRLMAAGYRPTSLRHLIAFCNLKNAREFEDGTAFVVSDKPIVNIKGLGSVRADGLLYAALLNKREMTIGIIWKENIRKFYPIIVLLEAPFPY